MKIFILLSHYSSIKNASLSIFMLKWFHVHTWIIVAVVVVSNHNIIYAATSLFQLCIGYFYLSLNLPRGLFLSISNYHITCDYYRIVSSNRGDKLSGFVAGLNEWMDGLCEFSNHANCDSQFNRTCFPLWSVNTHTHTHSRHDNQQTAHRHRNLSLLHSIAFTALQTHAREAPFNRKRLTLKMRNAHAS